MSKSYIRTPITVEAFQFTGQRVDSLPKWAQDYSAFTPMGTQTIGKDAVGQLLVPTANGTTETVRFDDYVVLTGAEKDEKGNFVGGGVSVVKKADFEANYTPAQIDEDAVVQVDTAPAAVAEEPQAAPAAGKSGKAKTTAEPETPAADAPASES